MNAKKSVTHPRNKRVHVIACGVLRLDIRALAKNMDIEASFDFLPGGLHERPGELRCRLQDAIDKASGKESDRIVIGYGLCGRGTVGLQARTTPLYLPRVQDCIALFLGSDKEYKRQFEAYPGTYYISAGWFREKIQPKSQFVDAESRPAAVSKEDRKHFEEKYGKEKAELIKDFYASWTKNYQRAVFIDTLTDKGKECEKHAQSMAQEFGWKYEYMKGDLSLMEKMLAGDSDREEIALIAPGYKTIYNAVDNTLAARPAVSSETGLDENKPEKLNRSKKTQATEKAGSCRGLGIDAGGTYTDAVIYDFGSENVIADSKALTTKWDFAEGIRAALDAMPPELLEDIRLVSVSTTLATNAIVEGQGQKVGLLLMPPPGTHQISEFKHHPAALLQARLSIDGSESQPIDEEQVRATALRMKEESEVAAFAVSGYGGTVNPVHELKIKEIIEEVTGCDVSCGHELSGMLNFKTRALTAVLNARIIPRLRSFLKAAKEVLFTLGVQAPLMVVKGDGTLIDAEVARRYPVETILSGPAASVAGARHLTDNKNATVIDVGGTTTDIAVLEGGQVRVSAEGTKAGEWQTHVRAVDMRTVGIGGDSSISREDGKLQVGPHRVAPISWAASQDSNIFDVLAYIDEQSDDFKASARGADILVRTARGNGEDFDEIEKEMLQFIAKRPYSLKELAAMMGVHHWSLLPLERLENSFMIQRCGLTPTDLLHVRGDFKRWDSLAARKGTEFYARISNMETDRFIKKVFEICEHRLAQEILFKHLDQSVNSDEQVENCEVCAELMALWMSSKKKNIALDVKLNKPVIGLGAPAEFFLPQVARLMKAEFISPKNAHVANAIGAITSNIVIQRTARIQPNISGQFVVEGIAGAPVFEDMESAQAHAEKAISEVVRQEARDNGAAQCEVSVTTKDRIAAASDGSDVFLERIVNAEVISRPQTTKA